MQFRIMKRDGPARIGECTVEKTTVKTPNIFYVHTDRFPSPRFADILITNSKRHKGKTTLRFSNHVFYPKDLPKELILSLMKNDNPESTEYCIVPGNSKLLDEAINDNPASLFIVAYAHQLFRQPKKFVEFMVNLQEKIGYQKVLYLPAVGEPASFALLAYMGIDFFDSLHAIQSARANTLLFPTGGYNKNNLQELSCNCPTCTNVKGKPSDMDFREILYHNYFALFDEIKTVRNAIAQENLRQLVETRVRVNPTLTAILRNLDATYPVFLEERTPVTSRVPLLATTKEAFSRPEIERFQERVITRYQKPQSTKVLLLLPCSAKKPYSFSKSHAFYQQALYASGNPHTIHELIITSPLGLVPRELELVYPASRYDIPVTGVWDEDEKYMVRRLLAGYLKNNAYDRIIVHLPPEITTFIHDLLKHPCITCTDSPLSNDALQNLAKQLKTSVAGYDNVSYQTRVTENVQALASYQFGKTIATRLLSNATIRGKYPYQKIWAHNVQRGMVIKERGLISLTMYGAESLGTISSYWVKIYDDFVLRGSVFAPGVQDADASVRMGDEVIVLQKNQPIAVGVAQMNGVEMKTASHGEAVKVRHKR